MGKYTFELRELFEPLKYNPPLYTREDIENWFKDYELTDYLTPKQIESINAWGLWTKDKLAKKIVDHYYMRESGFETPMLFKHYAKVEMQEIMEEYLPLIYSSSIEYDPLVNVDFTETFERTANVDSQGNSNASSNSTSNDSSSALLVASDTPQGNINKQNILNGNYASSTSANENETNVTNNTTTNTSNTTNSDTNEEYTKHVKGNSGVSATAQKMVEQYRQNIIAIDRDIIKKLNDLFMGLY